MCGKHPEKWYKNGSIPLERKNRFLGVRASSSHGPIYLSAISPVKAIIAEVMEDERS